MLKPISHPWRGCSDGGTSLMRMEKQNRREPWPWGELPVLLAKPWSYKSACRAQGHPQLGTAVGGQGDRAVTSPLLLCPSVALTR